MQNSTAAALYETLSADRDLFLRRAEKAAALTIPMLVPRNGNTRTGLQTFSTPRQGIGARGVNHLASRLLLTLLPPGSPFFRYELDPESRAILAQEPKYEAEVNATLARAEKTVQRAINAGNYRTAGAEIFKHLIVAGNVLARFPKTGSMSYHPLSQYVCVRDADGHEILTIVIKEMVARVALPEAARALAPAKSEGCDATHENSVAVFTRIERGEKKFEVRQEFENGLVIPNSEGSFLPDELPFRPLRWTAVAGEAYGRGLVEEFMGDLMTCEALSQSAVEGAVAASRLIGLVRPNSQTSPADLNKAPNGGFVRGIADDVGFLQVNKAADFRSSYEVLAMVTRRLEAGFLLTSSIIRDAERVTAEEVRLSATELESTLGGVYTLMAHEFQLPLVKILSAGLQKTAQIPAFNKLGDRLKPVIVTGVDALGRSAELDRLRMAIGVTAEMLGPDGMARWANADAAITYIFSQAGVDIEGLVKSRDEMAAEAQQAQQAQALQAIVERGTGPAIQAVSAATQAQNDAPQGA